MTLHENDSEQRKSFRCPVAKALQRAELKVGRRRFPVWLYNESLGGFAALADRDPGVAIGDLPTLYTAGGGYEVRVVHVSQVESAGADVEAGKPSFRIGLERLRELDPPAIHQGVHSGLLRRLGRRLFAPFGTTGIAIGLLVMVAATAGGVAMLPRLTTPLVKKLVAREHKDLRPVSSADQPLAQVAREVGLTGVQQVQLQEIAERTAQTLKEIGRCWKNDTPEERVRKQARLVEAANREVFRLLTDEQGAR